MVDRFQYQSYPHQFGDRYAERDGVYWRLPAGRDKPQRINRADYIEGVNQRALEEQSRDMPVLGAMVEGAVEGTTRQIGESFADWWSQIGEDPLAITTTRSQLGADDDLGRYAAVANQNPLATGTGQALATYGLPGMSAYRAAARFGGAGVNSLLGQSMVQAGTAGGVGALTTPGDLPERAWQGTQDALGAGIGTGSGMMIERIANRIRATRLRNTPLGTTSPEPRPGMRSADEFIDRGYDLSPAGVQGGGFARQLERPFEGAGWTAAIDERNAARLNDRAITALGGVPGDDQLDAPGMIRIYEKIGQKFDEALPSDVTVTLNPQTQAQNRVLQRDLRYADELGITELPAELSVREYQAYRQNLARLADRLSRNQAAPIGQLDAVENLIGALDDQFEAQAGRGSAELFREAREETKVFFTMLQGRALSPDGQINPASLHNAISRKWSDWRSRGSQGALPKTREFFRDVQLAASKFSRADPNSATASRQFATLKSLGIAGGAAGLGAYALGADPREAAAIGLGVGLGGPSIYSRMGRALHGRGGFAGVAAGQTGAQVMDIGGRAMSPIESLMQRFGVMDDEAD